MHIAQSKGHRVIVSSLSSYSSVVEGGRGSEVPSELCPYGMAVSVG